MVRIQGYDLLVFTRQPKGCRGLGDDLRLVSNNTMKIVTMPTYRILGSPERDDREFQQAMPPMLMHEIGEQAVPFQDFNDFVSVFIETETLCCIGGDLANSDEKAFVIVIAAVWSSEEDKPLNSLLDRRIFLVVVRVDESLLDQKASEAVPQ